MRSHEQKHFRVFVFSWLHFKSRSQRDTRASSFRGFVVKNSYCVTVRMVGAFGFASAFAMSQLAWCTSRAIFSIFT